MPNPAIFHRGIFRPLDLLVSRPRHYERGRKMAIYNVEGFKKELRSCKDNMDIDYLCLCRLRLAAMDEGKEGEAASKLLDVVGELLNL